MIDAFFKDEKAKVRITLTPPPIQKNPLNRQFPGADLTQLPNLIGKQVSVKGKVYGFKALANMTLIDLGAAHPNQLLTVVLKGNARDSYVPVLLKGKTISVSGIVQDYYGKPEIVLTDSKYLSVSKGE